MIPYGRQDISDEDVAAVVAVLRSDFLTQGPQVPAFEAAVAAQVGAAHALAVNSATSALHIACMALDLGPGDVLWTVPNTFVASANCALYCGASVDFVDIDPVSYTMCPQALAAKLKTAATLPKIIVPVHLCGQSADMAAIHALAAPLGIRVIEDASHAIGASYQGLPVGDCRHSDITVFSFHPVKIITTAEGGMCTTNDAALARKMDLARSHGITRDPAQMTHAPDGPWYYQMITLGYNYRMTELQAALGLSQMARLTEMVARRQALAARYDRLLANLPLTRPAQAPDTASSWHLYVIRLPAQAGGPGTLPAQAGGPGTLPAQAGGPGTLPAQAGEPGTLPAQAGEPGTLPLRAGGPTHATVFTRLRDAGIGVNLHYIPVHLHPFYRAMGFHPGQFPVSEAYYADAISIPLYFGLSDADQDRVVEALASALATG